MGLFSKKKVVAEEPPGFPELKKEIPPIEEIDKVDSNKKGKIKLPEISKGEEKEIPELPEQTHEEHEEEMPDIPGMEVIEVEKPKPKQIIPELKKEKELPEKLTHDVEKVSENPDLFYKKAKHIKQAEEERQKITKPIREDEDKSVFVRIEDFNSVTFSLNEIKNKLKVIEDNISDLKGLKAKEDSEIEYWEQEIMAIKERLINVDKTLSNKTLK